MKKSETIFDADAMEAKDQEIMKLKARIFDTEAYIKDVFVYIDDMAKHVGAESLQELHHKVVTNYSEEVPDGIPT